MTNIQKLQDRIDDLVRLLIKQGEAAAEPACKQVQAALAGMTNPTAYTDQIRRAAVAATLEKHGFLLKDDGSIDQSVFIAREFERWASRIS